MPRDPGYIDQWNYIVNFWTNPCNAPFSVYLELLKEPAGEAALRYVIPTVGDLAYAYARPSKAIGPSGAIPPRRGSKGKGKGTTGFSSIGNAWKKTPGLGTDIANFIGDKLPGAHQNATDVITDGQRYFWHFADWAERILFYFFIFDITTDLLYDWAILLDESEFCQAQDRGGLSYKGEDFSYGGVIPCNQVSAPEELWQEGDCSFNGFIGIVGPRPWQVNYSMQLRNTGAFPSNFFIDLGIFDLAGSRTVRSNIVTLQPGQTGGCIVNASMRGPGSFQAIACATVSTLIEAEVTFVNVIGGGPGPWQPKSSRIPFPLRPARWFDFNDEGDNPYSPPPPPS